MTCASSAPEVVVMDMPSRHSSRGTWRWAPRSVRLAYMLVSCSTVVSCSAAVAGAPSNGNALGPEPSTLSLTVYIADREYFNNEPVYVVFQITNSGSDTAWVMPFDLAEQSLQAVVVRSDGTRFPGWGLIADYFIGSGWRGTPILPQRSVYEIGMLQDRWGEYDSTLQNLYHSHHVLPGRYQVEAAFDWDPKHRRPPLRASAVPFSVRSRNVGEDSVLTQVNKLVAMPWDTAQRRLFLDSLVDYIEHRFASDSADPYLPFLAVQKVVTAAAVGYSADDAMKERLATLCSEIAMVNRDVPAGAEAVLCVLYNRPGSLPDLATQLGSSLAGIVARDLAKH